MGVVDRLLDLENKEQLHPHLNPSINVVFDNRINLVLFSNNTGRGGMHRKTSLGQLASMGYEISIANHIAPSCADVTKDPIQTEQSEVDDSADNSTELE